MRVPTVTGTLTITITKAHILHEASVFRMDPYLYLKVSNIKEKTKVVKNGDK